MKTIRNKRIKNKKNERQQQIFHNKLLDWTIITLKNKEKVQRT